MRAVRKRRGGVGDAAVLGLRGARPRRGLWLGLNASSQCFRSARALCSLSQTRHPRPRGAPPWLTAGPSAHCGRWWFGRPGGAAAAGAAMTRGGPGGRHPAAEAARPPRGRPSPRPRCGRAGRAGGGGTGSAVPRPLPTQPRARPRPEPRRGPAGCEPGAPLGLRRLRHAGAAGGFRGGVPSDRLPQRHEGAGAQGGAGPNSRHPLQPPAAPVPGPRRPLPDPFPDPAYSLDPGRPVPSEPAVAEGKPA